MQKIMYVLGFIEVIALLLIGLRDKPPRSNLYLKMIYSTCENDDKIVFYYIIIEKHDISTQNKAIFFQIDSLYL